MPRNISCLSFVVALIFVFAACGGGNAPGTAAHWSACPAYLEAGAGLECRTAAMPLHHDDAQGAAINVLVMRARGAGQIKKGQIWFLMGGPGESIASYAYPLEVWAQTHPEWDYYLVEHRGAGASSPLTCPGSADGSAECAADLLSRWGEAGLAMFNPTQAAHDLAAWMHRVGGQGRRFLYGFSYGTYLAQRFAHLYPDMLDGLILDGVVPAGPENGLYPIDAYDQNANQLVLDILQRCDDDATCGSRMRTYGADSLAVLDDTYARIDGAGLCADLNPLISRTALRQKLAGLGRDWWGRMVLPALLYRICRCGADDVEIIETLFRAQAEPEQEAMYPAFSYNLNTHIITSELIGGLSLDQAQAFSDSAYASPDETLDQYIARDSVGWPIYPLDAATYQWPATDIPMLLLNGDMDPQTPVQFARFAKSHYPGDRQYLVEFPTANHGTLMLTLLQGIAINDVDTCAGRILFDFVNDPDTPPDTSCTDLMIRPDFSGASDQARDAALRYFRTPNVWD